MSDEILEYEEVSPFRKKTKSDYDLAQYNPDFMEEEEEECHEEEEGE